MNRCRICKNDFCATREINQDVRERAPMDQTLCMACWIMGVELVTWLARVRENSPLGDWQTGWLTEILRRYDASGPQAVHL